MRVSLQQSTRVAMIAGALALAACSSYNNDNPTAPVVVSSNVPSALTSGTWTISSMMQGTEDKSSQFSGFVFVFSGSGETGTVSATKGGTSVTGTWSHSAAVTYYGGTSSNESLVLSFGSTTTPFNGLSGTWNVMGTTSSSLSLANPEVSEGEHLVFVKQ